MGGVILQLPRQKAPNSPAAIDWSNPLTAGLSRAWFASTGLDHVSGARATNNSPANNVPGQNQYGQTLRCNGAQAVQSYTLPNIAGMSKEFTVLTVSTTLSGGERPLAGVWGSLGNRQFLLAINSSRQPLFAACDGAVNRVYTATSATVPASSRAVVAGGWKASGDVCSLWVNGFPVAGTKTGTALSSLASTSLPVSVAAQSTGGAGALSGDIELVLIFSRLLSDVEIRALTINPYQVLQSRRRALWLDVVTGGVVTGTLSAAEASDTASFSGSASAPSVTGTLSATDPQDAASFAGALIFSGSLAATDSPDAATFSGTAYAPGFSGTMAATEASDLAAFSGALSFVGSITATEPQDQISLTGSTGSGGTLAATESVDTASLAGAFGAASFSGLLAATEATDVFAVSGSVMAPPIIGSLMAGDGQDVAVLAGYVPVYGVCAANDPIDYCVLAGTFGVPAGLRRTGASFSALRQPLNTPSALRPGSGAVRFGRNREITEV